jgi:hypothetical protein
MCTYKYILNNIISKTKNKKQLETCPHTPSDVVITIINAHSIAPYQTTKVLEYYCHVMDQYGNIAIPSYHMVLPYQNGMAILWRTVLNIADIAILPYSINLIIYLFVDFN